MVLGVGLPAALQAKTLAGTVEFERYDWHTVDTAKSIDPEAIAATTLRFGSDRRLADFGEPFEAADVDSDRPPRRFVLGGHAGNKWFVLYERGGRGHHLVLAVVDATAQGPRVTNAARCLYR